MMIKKITKVLAFIFLGNNSGMMAQQVLPAQKGMFPSFIKYENNQPDFIQNKIQVSDETGKTYVIKDAKLQTVSQDEQGMNHYRYQQEFNDIPVEHANWVVHSVNGKINSQNGKLIKTFPVNLEKKAGIKPKEALKNALAYIGAEKYKWQLPAEEEFLRREQKDNSATFYPKTNIVYYSGEYELTPAALRLAYKFDIYAQEPLSRKLVFVDAINGTILGSRELIHETNTNGVAVTAYSGSQNIRTDFTGTNYRLNETARGTGNGIINTYNLLQGTNYSAAVDFTDGDNNWNNINANKDEYATDAHWATEMTYDYYLIKHLRNSIDGLGFPLNSYVHYSTNYFNAFWDGSRMTYGDGNSANAFKPLTSLDVCGHEITHGVTERTSNLVYAYESGALNEGFSDIFGTAVEWYARPSNADWLIGGDFYTIRSMNNPNLFNAPDTYLGDYWYSGTSDYGGVHTNSGVLNYWFYLLVNGGTGINDHGVSYSVSGIGMNSAAKIAYKLNTFYLVSTSNYTDARLFGIQAASDLFGPTSNEAIQTANAWTAVGLYQTCANVINLTTTSVSENAANVSWDALPGAVYYVIEYKLPTESVWTYAGKTTTTSKTISGLTSVTLYDWRVKGSCSADFSQSQLTTTSPQCLGPKTIGATITGTTVNLEWSAAKYAGNYHLLFKQATDSIWVDSIWVAGTTYTLSGLFNNTLYDWKVEKNCSFDTSEATTSTFLTDAPLCDAPTGLNVSYGPGLTTIFSWTEAPGVSKYRLQIKNPALSWAYSGIDTVVTNDTLILVGLVSGVNFDCRVRSKCMDNLSSSIQTVFTTPCPAPSGLTVPVITSNSAVLNWVSGANTLLSVEVYYKLETSSSYSYAGSTNSTSFPLNTLISGKRYDVQIRQKCQAINSSYIQTQFTTLCTNIPAAVKATEIKTNGAKITWNAVSGASSYTLQYKKSNVAAWTTVSGIATTFYALSGLTAATVYHFKVGAACTYGSSAYSTVDSLKTYCISSGTNNQEWIDFFSLGTITRTSVADAGGYIQTGLTTNLVVGSTGNPGTISAGFSGSTKTEIFAIYIDLNKNGVFTDAGERVAGPTTFTTSGNVGFTFAVPTSASIGVTGMRIVMLRSGSATMAPCLTGNRGETEDYYVNLITSGSFIAKYSDAIMGHDFSGDLVNQVIPNPSDGIFRIEKNSSNDVVNYQIINVTGLVLEEGKVHSNLEFNIDLSQKPAGIYLLRLRNIYGKQQIIKLVKK